MSVRRGLAVIVTHITRAYSLPACNLVLTGSGRSGTVGSRPRRCMHRTVKMYTADRLGTIVSIHFEVAHFLGKSP